MDIVLVCCWCAESQITGSPPLLSDLDILCEMEHEGQGMLKIFLTKRPTRRTQQGGVEK